MLNFLFQSFLCIDNDFLQDGTCSVVWTPPVPGKYKVHIKLSGKPVKNSPFIVYVTDEGQKRAHLSLESTALSEVLILFFQNKIECVKVICYEHIWYLAQMKAQYDWKVFAHIAKFNSGLSFTIFN